MKKVYNLNSLLELIKDPGIVGIMELAEMECDAIDERIRKLGEKSLFVDYETHQDMKMSAIRLDGEKKGLRRIKSFLDELYIKSKIEEARQHD
jgi:hypothetical protein